MLPTNELTDPEVPYTDPVPAVATDQQEEYQELTEFSKARIQLQRLIDDWKSECEQTTHRRTKRDVNINIEKLHEEKKLDKDETLIPVRVIDTNIQREQPAYVNYLKNSRRIATFNSLSNPSQDTQKLELEFTRGMTYISWETPHYKNVDGAQTHGWDAIEVVLDSTKPLGVALEHVGHDNLYFPLTSIDIQFSKYVIRRYRMTLLQLETFAKPPFSFAAEQIEKIKASRKGSAKAAETLDVYKMFCKKDGAVLVGWFCLLDGCDDWLSAPVPLDLELVDPIKGTPIPTSMYPIVILSYRETEKPTIVEHYGRVYYDENKQEAQTAILSGYVNGLTRAANIYASPAKENGTGGAIKELENIVLTGGRVLSEPMQFWSPPYPDPTVLQALQYFDTANSQETNQPNFAVINRKDSRKTAKEISSAEDQQSLLNSVQLTMFSTFIRQTYNLVWLIVQSKAIRGTIAFLQIETQEPVISPLTGQPVGMQTVRKNDVATIAQIYDVRAAGDVDVIQRQETIQQMMNDWPVIQNTPLKDKFLQDLVRLKYPEQGDTYAKMLEQQPQLDALKGIVGRMATIMAGMVQQCPDMLPSLPPQQQADVQQLIQQGLQLAQPVAGAAPVPQPQAPPQQAQLSA